MVRLLFVLHSPCEVVWLGGCLVLVHQPLDNLTRLVHLLKTIGKHLLFLELLKEKEKMYHYFVRVHE